MQRRQTHLFFLLALCVALMAFSSAARPSDLQLADRLVGDRSQYSVQIADSFESIGSRFGVAPSVIAGDNSSTSDKSLQPGSVIWVDNRHIVPTEIKDGILINIPQRMLFLFKDGNIAASYPVALGKPSRRTPTGDFTVNQMQRDPVWIVPISIQREMARQGKEVETRVPAGPHNPLGRYWIGLDRNEVGIHSTIATRSIYHFSSHGCIRLHHIRRMLPSSFLLLQSECP